MIDIKLIRENPELVKENIKKKFQDHKLPLVDEVLELDAEARKTQQEADNLRAERFRQADGQGCLAGGSRAQQYQQLFPGCRFIIFTRREIHIRIAFHSLSISRASPGARICTWESVSFSTSSLKRSGSAAITGQVL